MNATVITEWITALAPVLSTAVVVASVFVNKAIIKAETDTQLERYKSQTKDDVNGIIKENIESVKNDLNNDEILTNKIKNDYTKHLKQCSEHKQYLEVKISELFVAIGSINKSIDDMATKHDIYKNNKAFIAHLWNTMKKATEILDKDDQTITLQYFNFIHNRIEEIDKYIRTIGLQKIDSNSFDIKMSQAIMDSKAYCQCLPLDRALVESYFSNKNLCVFRYKKELFKMLNESKRLNNIDGQYKTLTTRWTELLCNEFIRHFFIKGRE